jgi:hypothetical protein
MSAERHRQPSLEAEQVKGSQVHAARSRAQRGALTNPMHPDIRLHPTPHSQESFFYQPRNVEKLQYALRTAIAPWTVYLAECSQTTMKIAMHGCQPTFLSRYMKNCFQQCAMKLIWLI